MSVIEVSLDVTVTNSTVTSTPEWIFDEDESEYKYDNGDKAGGIVGYATSTTITNCKVSDSTITAYRDFGGIIGCAYGNYGASVSGCTVSNVTLTVDNSQNYKGYTSNSSYNVGEIIGRNINSAGNTSNTATGVTINYPYFEG